MPPAVAVAVFKGGPIEGEAVASRHPSGRGTLLRAHFTKIPTGHHGFHIHKAGDIRGEGCKGACDHFHVGPPCRHGAGPSTRRNSRHSGSNHSSRHSGDLGNLPTASPTHPFRRSYHLSDFPPEALWGRSLIVHADEDDLGKGHHPDSGTTGNSGSRIGCAIFGRVSCS